MTSIFDDSGMNVPCTVIEAGPCIVTQVRTDEIDGYNALQLGFDDKAEKNAVKAEKGHFKKAASTVKRKVIEFQGYDKEYKIGDSIGVDHFEEGEYVDVSGISKGKVFFKKGHPTGTFPGRQKQSRCFQKTPKTLSKLFFIFVS